MEGVNMLARAVAVTLGPTGRNVVLEQEFGPPQVCSDGVTIAKEIELENAFQNIGAQLIKVAATKTNDAVGDGTTTSIILAQNILCQGFKNIAAGASPIALKKGIDVAANAIKSVIGLSAKPVRGENDITKIATLAAHEEEMGEIIATVFGKIGKDGIVTIEESKRLGYEIEYVEGMQIDKGYISPYMATNQNSMITEIQDPYILITSDKISTINDLLPILEKLKPISRNIVIVADEIESDILSLLVLNKLKGNLNCLGVKAPSFGDRRKLILEDVATLVGGNVISLETGRRLNETEITDLGRCRKIIATKDSTTFVDGDGNSSNIQSRISQIINLSRTTESRYDREQLEERASKLSGGVSVIKVGAASEIELREKRQRIEDALSATRAAMDQGIVPGGGTCLIRAGQAVDSQLVASGDERTGINVLIESLNAPLKLIATNAGQSGEVILNEIKNNRDDFGYDASSDQFGNMFELGVIDPATVTMTALENAVSVAGMILTTESLITELNPVKLPAPYDD